MNNRIVDPDLFDEAINEFAFDYDWFVESNIEQDELFRMVSKFTMKTIHMSLQPQQSSLKQSTSGNHQELKYNWYCDAVYRVNIGDFFRDENGNYLHVDGVQQYDGWGVRQGTCTMVDLAQYKNLQDFIKYLEGEKIL